MIDITPNPIAIAIGPLEIHWYGMAYAVGLAVAYWVIAREARWRGLNLALLGSGIIVVAIAALIGGRLYHVIDQWQLYKDDLLRIVLPPYAGLGVYGGIVTGTIAAFLYTRWKQQPFLVWADAVAPGLFAMQAVARWGNFFNQELYGPPTTLPWGIAIDCAHRVEQYPCETFPLSTTHFHPLFLYESLSGLLGALVLIWLARRLHDRLLAGDLVLIFFIWYGTVRFVLESLKADNWQIFGIPTAQIFSGAFVVASIALLTVRHIRRGDPPSAAREFRSEPRVDPAT